MYSLRLQGVSKLLGPGCPCYRSHKRYAQGTGSLSVLKPLLFCDTFSGTRSRVVRAKFAKQVVAKKGINANSISQQEIIRSSASMFYGTDKHHCRSGVGQATIFPTLYRPSAFGRSYNLEIRYFHSSLPRWDGEPPSKPSSKVEETTNVLTEKIKGAQDGTVVPSPKRPLYKRIQDEILHYYHGFRLLFIDMRISAQLIWRILNGKSLSRREYKQLIRTTSDMFRLVPFSVFIIVPFMELLLPVFVKLFPGLLPSTFQTKLDQETKMKAELKVKLEMAKFLQETLDEMAPQAKGRSSQTAKEFAEFISKIRTTGSEVTNEEIMKYSKLFEDEITLDSLSRVQLVALCRVLEITSIGPTAMLRFQLRMKLRNLAADDQMIEKEGIEGLTYQELQQASKSRGMRAVGVTEERLRRQMAQWLQLSLHEKVPPSLLLLSRAMYLPDKMPASQQLQATLSALPDGAALKTKGAIGEREGKIDNKTRIELLREEERLIEEERKEARKAKPKVLPKPALDTPPDDEPEPYGRAQPAPMPTELGPDAYQHHADSVIGAVNMTLLRTTERQLQEEKLSNKDFETIETALDQIGAAKKKMILEKEELEDLKEEMKDYQEDLQQLELAIKQSGTKKVKVHKGAKRLFNKLNAMISDLEQKVETSGDNVDVEEDENYVATEELIAAMRLIKTGQDDPKKLERIARVLQKLDDNHDGKIEVDDLVKVIEIVGRENVPMTSQQLEEIVSILAKEETLEGHKKGNPA